MTRPEARRLGQLASAAYTLAALLVLVPLVDYVANVWPARLTEIGWRYPAEGLFAGFLLTPCLGLALASAVAAWRADFRALRVFSIVMMLGAVGLLPLCIDFVLNAAQLRHTAPPEALGRLKAGVLKVVVQYAFVMAALATSGFTLGRVARAGAAGDAHVDSALAILARPRSRQS